MYGRMQQPVYTDEYGKELIAKMIHRILHHLEITKIEFSHIESVYKIDSVKHKLIKFLDLYKGKTDETPSQYLSDDTSHIIAETIFKVLSLLSEYEVELKSKSTMYAQPGDATLPLAKGTGKRSVQLIKWGADTIDTELTESSNTVSILIRTVHGKSACVYFKDNLDSKSSFTLGFLFYGSGVDLEQTIEKITISDRKVVQQYSSGVFPGGEMHTLYKRTFFNLDE